MVQFKEDKAPINISAKIKLNENPLGLPKGTIINVSISIIDQYQIIKTSNPRFTKDLAKIAPKGTIARYSTSQQKTIIKYPKKTKLEIAEIVRDDLKKVTI